MTTPLEKMPLAQREQELIRQMREWGEKENPQLQKNIAEKLEKALQEATKPYAGEPLVMGTYVAIREKVNEVWKKWLDENVTANFVSPDDFRFINNFDFNFCMRTNKAKDGINFVMNPDFWMLHDGTLPALVYNSSPLARLHHAISNKGKSQ